MLEFSVSMYKTPQRCYNVISCYKDDYGHMRPKYIIWRMRNMRRKLSALLSIWIILAVMLAGAASAATPADYDAANPQLLATDHLYSQAAVLLDADSGDILFSKNENVRMHPASTTKIMTVLLAIESGYPLDQQIAIPQAAADIPRDSSIIPVYPGETMTFGDLLKGVILHSGNDGANAVAVLVAGSIENFAEKMNQRAAEIGCTNTHFVNPHGYTDENHYTTAYDVAVMSRELIQHELIKEYTTIWMDSIRNGEFELSNTNKLVYWYPGCTGLKTGYTSTAMYCLSATAERDGVEYIAVIMHADSINDRNNDAKALLNYAFANYTLCSLRPGEALPAIPVELGAADTVQPEFTGEEFALVPKGGTEAEYSVKLLEKVHAPVEAGDRLGTLTVTMGGETVAELPICAREDVPRIGFFGILSRLAGSLIGL